MGNIDKNDAEQQYLLFVSGMSVKSLKAIENFKLIYDSHLKDIASYKIIDIAKETGMATKYGIVAIPTLMRLSPSPARTLVGDLSDTKKILDHLGI